MGQETTTSFRTLQHGSPAAAPAGTSQCPLNENKRGLSTRNFPSSRCLLQEIQQVTLDQWPL